MSELEDLKKRVAELEKATKAPEPFVPMPMPRRDLTEGACMPPSAMKAMVDALPSSFFSDLRADARKPNPSQASSSPITSTPAALPQRRGTGWVEPRPLEPPPGVAIADRLMDHQDKIDRAEL